MDFGTKKRIFAPQAEALRTNRIKTMDIKKIVMEGVTFKRGKDESQIPSRYRPGKPKGKTISGAAKMRASYKTKKASR